MPKIAIVYHSRSGHTKAVAEAVAKGASSVPGSQVTLLNTDDIPAPNADRSYPAPWNAFNEADAIIFGSAIYMGDVGAGLKKFFEDSSGIWYVQGWKDKLAAGFANSGSMSGDKLHGILSMTIFAAQHSMVWVSTGLMPNKHPGDPEGLNRIGSFLGVSTQSNQGEGPDIAPPAGDRATAHHLGKRVAEAAVRWTTK